MQKFGPDNNMISLPNPGDGSDGETHILTPEQQTLLDRFLLHVVTGDPRQITGLFIPGYGGFYVVQPPDGKDGSVSPVQGVLTQFKRPGSQGVIGLIAHNYSAGKWFTGFSPGDEFYVLYGDGRYDIYQFKESIQYRAINGKNVYSDFVDLSSGQRLNVDQVYNRVYSGKPHLTLQTCIQEDDDLTWGRMFIIAEPVVPGY